jgi:hypothetical protein
VPRVDYLRIIAAQRGSGEWSIWHCHMDLISY